MGQVVLRLKNEAGGRSLVPRGPAVAEVQTEPITGGDLSSQVFALGPCVWWCALNLVAPISAQGAERPLKGILYSPCCDVRFFSYDTLSVRETISFHAQRSRVSGLCFFPEDV